MTQTTDPERIYVARRTALSCEGTAHSISIRSPSPAIARVGRPGDRRVRGRDVPASPDGPGDAKQVRRVVPPPLLRRWRRWLGRWLLEVV